MNERKIAIRKDNSIVTIEFNSENYFGLSASCYELTVTSEQELEEQAHEYIMENLEGYAGELETRSISDLVDEQVSLVMGDPVSYNDCLTGEVSGDDLVTVECTAAGQCLEDLLELFPESKLNKELVGLWDKYQLKKDVDQSIIDRVNMILDYLDSRSDEWLLADDVIDDYLETC